MIHRDNDTDELLDELLEDDEDDEDERDDEDVAEDETLETVDEEDDRDDDETETLDATDEDETAELVLIDDDTDDAELKELLDCEPVATLLLLEAAPPPPLQPASDAAAKVITHNDEIFILKPSVTGTEFITRFTLNITVWPVCDLKLSRAPKSTKTTALNYFHARHTCPGSFW
ncbi:MAG TPA: hypothetical protein VHL14_05760 [Steroidobacteraceae bacterium]|nr:hypothetical protein [Steroidobacteraceae bacterium]